MSDLFRKQDLIDAIYVKSDDDGYYVATVEDIEEIIKGLPSAEQWIPCSERLPEKETHWYLVCSSHGQIKVDCWHSNDGRWDWSYMFEPIAWMPLPEPYKESSDD